MMGNTFHPTSHACPLTVTDKYLRATKAHLERIRRLGATEAELQHAMKQYHAARADHAVARKGGPRREQP